MYFFHCRTVHFNIITDLLPTHTQENCFNMSIKIYIKTAPTCFGVIIIIRERTIMSLEASIIRSLIMVITPKHVGAVKFK